MFLYLVDTQSNKATLIGKENELEKRNRKIVERDQDRVIKDSKKRKSNGLCWSENKGFYVVDTPPQPSVALEKITDKFIEWEGNTDSGLDRLDDLLNSYPTADRALSNGDYDIVKNRINKAEANGDLTNEEATTIVGYLEGES